MSASASRIPIYKNDPYMWFRAMHELGLIFHPEENPADIIIDNPKAKGPGFLPFFTPTEISDLKKVIKQISKKWGDPCTFAYQVGLDMGDFKE
jgi:hypothetical protein